MAEKQRILIVDDDANIAELISLYLMKECYETMIVGDGEEALKVFPEFKPNLVLLDLMLPGIDGYQVCRELRASSQVPVIMLSAKGEIFDKVLGLELGADDYLIKPFSYIELLARVKSLLRRIPQPELDCYQVENLILNRLSHAVYRDQQKIELTSKEFVLLELLMQHHGEVLTRTQIASMVWNINFQTDTNVVDVAIRRLRAKVDDPFNPKLIQTVRGMGYKLGLLE